MVYFSDFFNVSEEKIEQFGALNISLINDLPLFIDPFLLFGSTKEEYKKLHEEILEYLEFLRAKSEEGEISDAQIKSWYVFREVKQNWLGYSLFGNGGSGLGMEFGKAMSDNMHYVFKGNSITQTKHLEKVGLFQIGVGKDNISDFTTNLIKHYLLDYTEKYSNLYLEANQVKSVSVEKAYFDYEFERWMPKSFKLPYYQDDYIILTPKDILTKDDSWINSNDLKGRFTTICNSISNDQLRSEIHNYFKSKLPFKKKGKVPTAKERNEAIQETLLQFPELLDYYIKSKELNKTAAKKESFDKIKWVEALFIKSVTSLINKLNVESDFYNEKGNSYDESIGRIHFLKDVIENKDGYRLFYVDGSPIKREKDLQILFRFTWYASPLDVNREPNNGRGPVDYAVSRGAKDKSLVEFKLASNTKLKSNIENQVKIYEKANGTNQSIKVIMFFTYSEYLSVKIILKELNLENDKSIILIDARNDNKVSASNVKSPK